MLFAKVQTSQEAMSVQVIPLSVDKSMPTFRSSGGNTLPLEPVVSRIHLFAACQKPSKTLMLRSGKIKTVKVHDFGPHRHKVMQELLL